MDKLMEYVVHVTLCPGDYQESCKVCQSCPMRNKPHCRRELKKDTLQAYHERANTVSEANSSYNMKSMITTALKEIGIPAHIKGYNYLRHAIELVILNPEYQEQITCMLYPEVARAFDTRATRVERAIRHAVEVAWDRGDLDVLQKWFGFTTSVKRGKPTNSEFIAQVADTLRMEVQRNG